MDITSLKSEIGDYLHRDDLTAALIDGFIEKAYTNVNELARFSGQEARTTITATDGLVPLPADWLQTRSLEYTLASGIVRELPATDVAEAGRYANGTHPIAYTEDAGAITLWPAASGDVELVYYAALPVPSSGTDLYLTRYPAMMLDASLEQAYKWEQSTQLEMKARGDWQGAVALANESAKRARLGSRARAARPSRPATAAGAT